MRPLQGKSFLRLLYLYPRRVSSALHHVSTKEKRKRECGIELRICFLFSLLFFMVFRACDRREMRNKMNKLSFCGFYNKSSVT